MGNIVWRRFGILIVFLKHISHVVRCWYYWLLQWIYFLRIREMKSKIQLLTLSVKPSNLNAQKRWRFKSIAMDRNKVFINNIYVFYEKFCKNCKKKPVLEPLIKLQSCNKQLYLKKRNCQISLNSTKSTALLKTTSGWLLQKLKGS